MGDRLQLAARAERDHIRADPDDLAYVALTICDEVGVVPCDRDATLTVEVSGPAVLAGLASGRARTEERLDADAVTTYDGRALAVLRPTGPGELRLRVTAPGFESVEIALECEE